MRASAGYGAAAQDYGQKLSTYAAIFLLLLKRGYPGAGDVGGWRLACRRRPKEQRAVVVVVKSERATDTRRTFVCWSRRTIATQRNARCLPSPHTQRRDAERKVPPSAPASVIGLGCSGRRLRRSSGMSPVVCGLRICGVGHLLTFVMDMISASFFAGVPSGLLHVI